MYLLSRHNAYYLYRHFDQGLDVCQHWVLVCYYIKDRERKRGEGGGTSAFAAAKRLGICSWEVREQQGGQSDRKKPGGWDKPGINSHGLVGQAQGINGDQII